MAARTLLCSSSATRAQVPRCYCSSWGPSGGRTHDVPILNKKVGTQGGVQGHTAKKQNRDLNLCLPDSRAQLLSLHECS